MSNPFAALNPFHYRVIMADPAWNFIGGGDRNAREHYECMSLDDIEALPVGELASGDCALFLWVTDPFLEAGLRVMAKWGFRYASVAFHWAKTTKHGKWHMGTGYGTRANVETCLLGMMGDMRLPKDRGVRRLVVDKVREHSRKPDRIAADIERLYDGPYVELFARTKRPGWDSWGLEVEKFEADAA
jgi:N6-adenosine-specific RNA methylase IME4